MNVKATIYYRIAELQTFAAECVTQLPCNKSTGLRKHTTRCIIFKLLSLYYSDIRHNSVVRCKIS